MSHCCALCYEVCLLLVRFFVGLYLDALQRKAELPFYTW